MKMNYNIVEGRDYYEEYPSFIEEYNKGTLQKNIMSQLGIGIMKYRNFLKQATEEGLVVPRRQSIKKNAKYYTRKKNGDYVIMHRDKNGKMKYFGTYHSKESVEARVKELINCDWEV